ncbi:hypothetical protein [Pantoea phage LIMEzero]|uniref:Uncharacterized protein n=1 Tax=Pantoea phage LIMEzero TaxID=943335 RepID=F4N9R4_9CAUD|nr:hypothetical protein LIMEzero_ORF11 [Pantoea phage LIMEzero]CBY88542.1 hypothetical protein [Pantoea phage LIMEzero]
MKHLAQTIIACLVMALALIIFCPSVHAAFLPVVELDARDSVMPVKEDIIPVCVIDTRNNGIISTIVYPDECISIIAGLRDEMQRSDKTALIHLTINGQHINLI